MYAEYGVPPEIENGLIRLLNSIAFPAGKSPTFGVVTRDSALWYSNYPNEQINLFDVSLLTPSAASRFVIEEQILHRLITNSGWSEDRIKNSEPNFVRMGGPVLPELVLLDENSFPVAVVSAWSVRNFVGTPLKFAVAQAEAIGVRYAVLTNGQQVVVFDRKSDLAISKRMFPSPEDLALEAPVFDFEASYKDSENILLNLIFDFPELVHRLTVFKGPILLDHTLPWGQDVSPAFHDELPGPLQKLRLLDFLDVLVGLCAISNTVSGVVGILLPSVLSSSRHKAFRELLAESHRVEAIVELPSELFRPYTTVRSSILKLAKRNSAQTTKTFFFSIPNRGDILELGSQPWYQEFLDGLKGKTSSTGFHAELMPEVPWTSAAYHPDTAAIAQRLSNFVRIISLGSFFFVIPGFKHSRKEAESGKGTPILRGRDITRSVQSSDELTRYELGHDAPEQYRIREGDILVQRIGENPKCLCAVQALAGCVASDTIIILRQKRGGLDSGLIADFLNSSPGQSLLITHLTGGGVRTLSGGLLHRMPIPFFEESVSKDIQELGQMEQLLSTKLERVRSLRSDVFSASTSEDFLQRLNTIRNVSKAISDSVHQSEALSFQIRNLYPYPLAYGYRLLAGITNHAELYGEQLRVAENILAFMGSLSLALLEPEDRLKSGIDLTQCWRGGISPGDWRTLFQTSADTLASYKSNRLAQRLVALRKSKNKNAFLATVNNLIEAKNHHKHDRGPKIEEDFRLGNQQAQAWLDQCMKELAFLIEHLIRLVRDINVARAGSGVLLTTLRCVGDHPGLEQEIIQYLNPLPKDDLYIEVEAGRWISLHPFISPHYCPQCKAREFYFIDKWQGSGEAAATKSFERGHVEKRGDIGSELEKWGSLL